LSAGRRHPRRPDSRYEDAPMQAQPGLAARRRDHTRPAYSDPLTWSIPWNPYAAPHLPVPLAMPRRTTSSRVACARHGIGRTMRSTRAGGDDMVGARADSTGPKRVLVATDRSETADTAVRWAAGMVAAFQAELVLLQILVPEL